MSTISIARQVERVEGAPSLKRRRYWIQPRLQGRFMGWLAGVSAVAATTASWVVLLAVWAPLSEQLSWAGAGGDANSLFWDASARVLVTTGLLVAIFALMALLVGLITSHRVAGPLHRIALIAARVSHGQYRERVRLRQEDYIHDFADTFNQMLDQVEVRVRRQQRGLSEAENRLGELHAAIAEGQMDASQLERPLRETLRILREARLEELVEDTPPASAD